MKAGWVEVSIGEVATIARGGSPRPIQKFLTNSPDGVNWIKIGDATKSGKYIYETAEKIIAEGVARSRLVKDGDFLLSNSMSFGRPYIMRTSGCIHDGWLVLTPNNAILDQDYLYRLLGSPQVFDQFDSLAAGSTVRNLNTTLVSRVRLPLPPLDEQKRIVAILDEAFEGLDHALANAEANLADAQELSTSIIKNQFDIAGAAWPRILLPEICKNLDSHRIPITKAARQAGEVPYYGASGIVDYVAGHIFEEDLLLVSEDGANLLARTYPIAFSIAGKAWVNNHAHVLKFSNLNDQRFVEIYLNSISLEPFVSGMAQPKLNQKALNSIPIPFPTSDMREHLVTKILEIKNNSELLAADFNRRLSEFNALRQSLLQKAFAGELT